MYPPEQLLLAIEIQVVARQSPKSSIHQQWPFLSVPSLVNLGNGTGVEIGDSAIAAAANRNEVTPAEGGMEFRKRERRTREHGGCN